MVDIHPSSVISSKATLGKGVRIGPFCVVGPDVVLQDSVVLYSHAVVEGRTRVGVGTEIFPFASIGQRPQDLKYAGEPSELVIGASNTIREYVTMNPGTEGGGMVTRVGDGCLFMVGAHVAHDCQIGDRVIMANNATLAGHVVVEDDAIIGGLAAVHQFVRIGRRAMVGGMSGVEHDVIPFGLVMGERATLKGLNVVGLKRGGFARDDIQSLQSAYDAIFARTGTVAERLCEIERQFRENATVGELLAFVRSDSSRALCKPKPEHGG
jgi:UDP-N-acetylglucosamine acyltransferase